MPHIQDSHQHLQKSSSSSSSSTFPSSSLSSSSSSSSSSSCIDIDDDIRDDEDEGVDNDASEINDPLYVDDVGVDDGDSDVTTSSLDLNVMIDDLNFVQSSTSSSSSTSVSSLMTAQQGAPRTPRSRALPLNRILSNGADTDAAFQTEMLMVLRSIRDGQSTTSTRDVVSTAPSPQDAIPPLPPPQNNMIQRMHDMMESMSSSFMTMRQDIDELKR